jgi:hypothetical protein
MLRTLSLLQVNLDSQKRRISACLAQDSPSGGTSQIYVTARLLLLCDDSFPVNGP